MAYVPTTFVDRSVEFPNRRKFTAVSGQTDTFDVARAEGTVFAEGTKPDAANLNAEFGKIKTETDSINTSLTAPTVGMFIYDYQNGSHGFNTSPTRGADTFHPFDEGKGVTTASVSFLAAYNAGKAENQLGLKLPMQKWNTCSVQVDAGTYSYTVTGSESGETTMEQNQKNADISMIVGDIAIVGKGFGNGIFATATFTFN